MSNNLKHLKFSDIDLSDQFFNSLKNDYPGFEDWFLRRQDKFAYVLYNDEDRLEGLLYLKLETGPIEDVTPPLHGENILKIGTFKINPHGTRLGERFIKKALDYAVSQNASLCYVTIFEKHDALIQLLEEYGFIKHGLKYTANGEELVLCKDLRKLTGNMFKDYPLIDARQSNKYILSIYPKYHSHMFPDSILKTEKVDILDDVSYTNSIHKIYVASMPDIAKLRQKDILVMYRTADEGRSAEYSSVVTAICVVDKVKRQSEFFNFNEFYEYASTYSIFDKADLWYWYAKGTCYTIKMTYNVALSKRIIRHELIESIGVDRNSYWGILPITDIQFNEIVRRGVENESIIIN